MSRGAYYNEIDAFCCDVLRARIADGSLPPGHVDERDIRAVNPDELRDYGQVHLFAGIGGGGLACRLAGVPDAFRIVTGGVPCQDASVAGKQLGAQGERWLWPEALAVLRTLGGHVALLENPPNLLALHGGREFGEILGELAAQRRDVEWDCVPACAVGAPHQRDRLWIIAYPDGGGLRLESERGELESAERSHALALHYGAHWPVADADRLEDGRLHRRRPDQGAAGESAGAGEALADADSAGRGERRGALAVPSQQHSAERGGETVADTDRAGQQQLREGEAGCAIGSGDGRRDAFGHRGVTERTAAEWWAVEPDVGRVAHGIPARVDRLRALGNAWVPQAAVPALRVILARYANEASA